VSVVPVEIAGLRIDLRLNGPAPVALARYAPFACSAGPAAFTLDLALGRLEISGRVTRRVVETNGRWRVQGVDHLGWLDPETGLGEAVADPSFLVVDGLVRAAVARHVLSRGGILLHAGAVRVDGRAHLFPGRSGSGKSTLAGLASEVLSDEAVAVLPSAAGYMAHATPWWRTGGGAAPLAGIYTLAWHGEAVKAQPQAAALRHVVTNLVLPLDGPSERADALSAAARLATAVPFARLSFRVDSNVDCLLRGPSLARTG
jgi:hypothetical protein